MGVVGGGGCRWLWLVWLVRLVMLVVESDDSERLRKLKKKTNSQFGNKHLHDIVYGHTFKDYLAQWLSAGHVSTIEMV